MSYTLNHPYFMYPGGPLSEYNKYKNYNSEVVRLLEYLIKLNGKLNSLQSVKNNYILIPFIIGSAMEQAIKGGYNEPNSFFQWQQLFPNYINNFIDFYSKIDNSSVTVYIIIVSPDIIFSNEYTYDPLFTLFLYEFKKIAKNKYIYTSQNVTIKINIFNCPLPSIDNRKDVYDKINNMLTKFNDSFTELGIDSYNQTVDDINFINNFYLELENLYKKNNYENINIIVNSWASFKNLEGFQNFKMFYKVLELANENNILVTEWTYRDTLFCTNIVSKFISYQDNSTNSANSANSTNPKPKICIFLKICYIDPSISEIIDTENFIEYYIPGNKKIYYIDFDGKLCIRCIQKD